MEDITDWHLVAKAYSQKIKNYQLKEKTAKLYFPKTLLKVGSNQRGDMFYFLQKESDKIYLVDDKLTVNSTLCCSDDYFSLVQKSKMVDSDLLSQLFSDQKAKKRHMTTIILDIVYCSRSRTVSFAYPDCLPDES